MLRSDHRGLRNRDLKLMWVVVVGGGGWWWVVVVVGVQGENRDSLALVNCRHSSVFRKQGKAKSVERAIYKSHSS